MDPLSVIAGIVALLQITNSLLSYLDDLREAPKEHARLAIEASNLYSLLKTLRFRVEQSSLNDHGSPQSGT